MSDNRAAANAKLSRVDKAAILHSIAKTNKLVIVHEAVKPVDLQEKSPQSLH